MCPFYCLRGMLWDAVIRGVGHGQAECTRVVGKLACGRVMEYGRFGETNLVIVVSFAVSFKDGGFISDSVLDTGTVDYSSSVRARACCWLLYKDLQVTGPGFRNGALR